MNAIKYRVSLDMFDTLSQATIKAKKCDSACQIHITLTEHGKIYNISEGCYATFNAKKSDGTFVYNDCTIEGNTIVYDFGAAIDEDGICQVSAREGIVECEVTLYTANSEQLTSPRFTLFIDGTVYNGEEIVSSPKFDAFKKFIEHKMDATKGYIDNLVSNAKEELSADQTYDPESTNAQSGIAVAQAINHEKYFEIVDEEYRDGKSRRVLVLKPQYRGATIDFSTITELTTFNIIACNNNSKSDNGTGVDGSLINSLPETLYIPETVNGESYELIGCACFAYNKRIKEIVIPKSVTMFNAETFAYATNLEKVKNTEQIITVAYGAFFASGVIDLSFPNLTTLTHQAFRKSGHLKYINLGKITSIPDRCFEHCSDLEVIESENKITSVGVGAFFNTSSLRNADFVYNLTNIGDYAFKRCALNFNWVEFAEEKGSGVTFGEYATPLQMAGLSDAGKPLLTSRHYNIKVRERMLPAPLRLDQGNPEWVDLPLNINETYATSCRYMSVMNAYCGFNDLEYDDVYSLAEINTKKNVYIDKEISSGDEFNAYLENIDSDTSKPIEIGEIARYIGEDGATYINAYNRSSKTITETEETFKNNHYYQLTFTSDKKQSLWVDLGDRQLTNMDLFSSDGSFKCMDKWYMNLGLKDGELFEPTPNNYYRILEALQNGSYVVMNVPNAYNHANGHAIVLYGLNANGEVLFVESSVPGRNAIGDYTACTGSMLLQNMVSLVENNGTVLGFPKCYTISKLPETLTNGTVMVADGKSYEATEEISELTIQYNGILNPTNDFICSLVFTTATDGAISIVFPKGTKFIGGRPTFSNGETWELNIMNGVVVGGKVE